MILFKKIDVFSSSLDEWSAYHTFRRLFQAETEPEYPIIDDKIIEEQIKANISNNDMIMNIYRIYFDKIIIGSFYFAYYEDTANNFTGNEKIVEFEIKLLKKYQKQVLITKCLQIIAEESRKLGKSMLISEYQRTCLKPFFEEIGATIAQTNTVSRLFFSEIGTDLLNKWIKEAERKNPGTGIYVLKERVPDNLVLEYVKSFNEIKNQMPLDQLEKSKRTFNVKELRQRELSDKLVGNLTINVITVEKNGVISALTQVKRFVGKDKFFWQGLTGVVFDYRGIKLGKWVKARMLLFLKENYPKTVAIDTGNADSNIPMLHINNQLGFKKFKETISIQISLENLEIYLKSIKLEPIQVIKNN